MTGGRWADVECDCTMTSASFRLTERPERMAVILNVPNNRWALDCPWVKRAQSSAYRRSLKRAEKSLSAIGVFAHWMFCRRCEIEGVLQGLSLDGYQQLHCKKGTRQQVCQHATLFGAWCYSKYFWVLFRCQWLCCTVHSFIEETYDANKTVGAADPELVVPQGFSLNGIEGFCEINENHVEVRVFFSAFIMYL